VNNKSGSIATHWKGCRIFCILFIASLLYRMCRWKKF